MLCVLVIIQFSLSHTLDIIWNSDTDSSVYLPQLSSGRRYSTHDIYRYGPCQVRQIISLLTLGTCTHKTCNVQQWLGSCWAVTVRVTACDVITHDNETKFTSNYSGWQDCLVVQNVVCTRASVIEFLCKWMPLHFSIAASLWRNTIWCSHEVSTWVRICACGNEAKRTLSQSLYIISAGLSNLYSKTKQPPKDYGLNSSLPNLKIIQVLHL